MFDDVGVFIRQFDDKASPGFAGFTFSPTSFGGSTSDSPKLRVSSIKLSTVFTNSNNAVVDEPNYGLVALTLHEIGHALGLVGFNYTGAQLVNRNVTPPVFTGSNTVALNGGNMVLDSAGIHPTANTTTNPPQYHSIMSYLNIFDPVKGGIYDICLDPGHNLNLINSNCGFAPLDFALLKDHGWVIQ